MIVLWTVLVFVSPVILAPILVPRLIKMHFGRIAKKASKSITGSASTDKNISRLIEGHSIEIRSAKMVDDFVWEIGYTLHLPKPDIGLNREITVSSKKDAEAESKFYLDITDCILEYYYSNKRAA